MEERESPTKEMFVGKDVHSRRSTYENGKFLREFMLLEVKGAGVFSRVYSVVEIMTGRKFALKVMKSNHYNKRLTKKPVPFSHSNKYESFNEIETRQPKVIEESLRELEKSCYSTNIDLGVGPVIRLFQFWAEEVELGSEIQYQEKSSSSDTGFELFEQSEERIQRTFVTFSFIVMELGEDNLWSSLVNKKINLDLKKACRVLMNISKCLALIHENGYQHNDFKATNVIVMNYEKAFESRRGIVISDFGLPTRFRKVDDIVGFKTFFTHLAVYCPDLKRVMPNFGRDITSLKMVEEYLRKHSKVNDSDLYFMDGELRKCLVDLDRDKKNLQKKVQHLTNENMRLNSNVLKLQNRVSRLEGEKKKKSKNVQEEDNNITGKKSKRREMDEKEDTKSEKVKEPASKKRKLD